MMSGGFTQSQWVELEHQALIYKYLMAGVPVPPDLLLPIRRSFDPLQSPFYHHSSLGYYAYYGKKLDPEPWRCRRTDGKKWRCAKEAYPDSKYCERHMHRGRNRSRKPVESSSNTTNSISTNKAPSPPITSSLLTSVLNPAATRSFDAVSSPMVVSGNGGSQGLCLGGSTNTQSYLNRYSNTLKLESGEHHFFSDPSGTAGYGTMDSAMTSLSSCRSRETHALGVSSYSSYGDPMQEELGQVVTISSLPQEQQKPPQHSFSYGFKHEEPVKPENQFLRPFFDEWPKSRESWIEFDSERSSRNSSFSTTRLSISIPMSSSASSPNDE